MYTNVDNSILLLEENGFVLSEYDSMLKSKKYLYATKAYALGFHFGNNEIGFTHKINLCSFFIHNVINIITVKNPIYEDILPFLEIREILFENLNNIRLHFYGYNSDRVQREIHFIVISNEKLKIIRFYDEFSKRNALIKKGKLYLYKK